MTTERTCPKCGGPLPDDAPEGLCPPCLLEQALETIVGATGLDRAAARERLAAANPGGRLVAPSEVAAAVTRLCAGSAAAVNGQSMVIPEDAG